MTNTFKFSVAAAMIMTSAALAQDAKPQAPKADPQPAKTMTIGDAAPAIDVSNWVMGDKVAKFDSGKVYVVEFWATWCGPCKVSMPHITDLQKQYKDYGVTFIGISDEPLETVTKWLDTTDTKSNKKWSEVVGYTLTTDPDKSVMNDYFRAAGQNGIPCAFIVGKDQHVEWIGHPMNIEKPLDAVVKDSWDRAAFKTTWEKQEAASRDAMKSQQALAKATKDKDWAKIIEIADGMLAADPKNLDAALLKFRTLAGEMNEGEKAYTFIEKYLSAQYWEDPEALNAVAWTILDDSTIKVRNLEGATLLAMRANKLSDEKNPAILDTYARCCYERGNLEGAVQLQMSAAKLAGDDQMGADIKATLKKYQDELAAKKGG